MRTLLLAIALVLFVVPSAFAEEGGCPAHKAEGKGFSAMGELHHVVAPLWHHAYPDKDYAAMKDAAPKLTAAFVKLAEMKGDRLNDEEKKAFADARAALGQDIEAFAKFAEAGEDEALYAMLPGLHEKFEAVASVLVEARGGNGPKHDGKGPHNKK